MRAFLGIAGTGLTALFLYPLRSLVTVACLVAVLLPYLVGLGLSRGVQQEAEDAIRFGADIYVTGNQFGRTVPVPLTTVAKVREVEGVLEVVPRIVGGIVLGKDRVNAVVVGIPTDHFPAGVDCVEGRLPAADRGLGPEPSSRPLGKRNELVIGSELAQQLHLRVGDLIPPFYHNRQGERISEVVGIFRSDVSLWQAHLVFTTFDTAASLFDQQGLATDLLVSCRPGFQDKVRLAIQQSVHLSSPEAGGTIRAHATTREDLETLLPRGLLHREGIFNLLFVLAFAVGILVVLVTSGVGLSGRRREIGILKATGWQTDEILLRDCVESFLLSLTAASVSILLAYFWLEGLNGYGIASVFLAGVERAPSFKVPFRLTPLPALLAYLIAFTVVMSGTLWSSWRAATVPPFEAIRSGR